MNHRIPVTRCLRLSVFLLTLVVLEARAFAYNYPNISQTSANVGYALPIGRSLAQSFTAIDTGSITHVGLSTNGGNFDIQILEGDGVGGTVIFSRSNIFFQNQASGTSYLYALPTPVRVTGDQVYTLRLKNVSAPEFGTRFVHSSRTGTDKYTGGRRYTLGGPDDDPLADLAFVIRSKGDLEIFGNDILIPSGTATASTADGTDFGAIETPGASRVIRRSFKIKNVAGRTLTLSPMSIQHSQFDIVTQPAATLASGATTTFTVEFSPTGTSTHATYVRLNADGGPAPYFFRVVGEGLPDNTAPVPVLTGPSGFVTSSFTVEVDFGEPVLDFKASHITVTNGTATTLTSTGLGTYTATIAPSSDGPVTVKINASKVFDEAYRSNLASNTISVEADLTAPRPVITGPTTPQNGAFQVSADFGEPVTGLLVGEFVVARGTASGLSSTDGQVYTVTVTPALDGTTSVRLPQQVATDASGRRSVASNVLSVPVDMTPPVATLGGPTAPQSAPFTLTIDFGETVTGFLLEHFIVTNGEASDLVDAGEGEYSVLITPATDGPVLVAIEQYSVTDAAGSLNPPGGTFSVEADLTAPVPLLTGPEGPVGGPFTLEVAFGEPVDGLVIEGFAVMNGVASDISDEGEGNFTVMVTPEADGDVTVMLTAGVTSDLAGNASLPSSSFRVLADLTAPVPTLTGPAGIQTGAFEVSIDFGERVTGLIGEEIDVGNGALTALATEDGQVYVATIATAADGALTVQVPALVAYDAAGLGNHTSELLTVAVDLAAPRPVLAGPTTPQGGAFLVNVAFGETVLEFQAEDLDVTNGAASELTDVGAGAYTVVITPADSGPVVVVVPSAVATDAVGYPNLASEPLTVTADLSAPVPSLAGPQGPVSAAFTLEVAFSEPVAGFSLEALAVSGGNASDLVDEGEGAYSATITPTADGELVVSLAAAAARDEAGNQSEQAPDYRVQADLTAPAASVSGPTVPQTGPFSVTISFGEAVVDFALEDIVVGNGSASDLSDGGDGTFTVQLTAAHDGDLTIDIAAGVASDPAGNASLAAETWWVLTALCGDGITNAAAGEVCDDRADSASCDADCSVATCGDGYLNAASGEECDEGSDTEACDADCTLPVCGDGHLNAAIEACDDGNTADGDGCAANCTVEKRSALPSSGCGCASDSGSAGQPVTLLLLLAGALLLRRQRATASA